MWVVIIFKVILVRKKYWYIYLVYICIERRIEKVFKGICKGIIGFLEKFFFIGIFFEGYRDFWLGRLVCWIAMVILVFVKLSLVW